MLSPCKSPQYIITKTDHTLVESLLPIAISGQRSLRQSSSRATQINQAIVRFEIYQ